MAEFWDIVDEQGNKTGKIHQRGLPLKDGEYHLSVSVWIKNSEGRFLISKRVADKPPAPGMWEITGGSVVSGENPFEAALRETKEEIGIDLEPDNGRIFSEYPFPLSNGNGGCYITVWIFTQDFDISEVVLQPGETCDAKWASKEDIRNLIAEGLFINYTYLDDLFSKN